MKAPQFILGGDNRVAHFGLRHGLFIAPSSQQRSRRSLRLRQLEAIGDPIRARWLPSFNDTDSSWSWRGGN